MEKTLHVTQFEAIDPLALLLPTPVYVKLIEGRYPHVPLAGIIDKAVAGMSKDEKQIVQERARKMVEVAQVVEKAMHSAAK